MCSRLQKITTCTKLVTERQYAICSDFNGQIRSKLHSCMRTVKNGYFMGRSHGMIYSLTFDPTGAYLVATCSNNSFFLYDPRFNRAVSSNPSVQSHDDNESLGVNCATFLAPQNFATGSDNGKVALWDARNITAPLKMLRGHEHSVKNIEYDEKSNRLFTIAADELVLCWDLNKVTETVTEKCDVIMRIPRICRLRLAPDGSKLLVTTQQSCLIIISNFHGLSIVEDLHNSDRMMDKIARSFYTCSTNAIDMLQRDERKFLAQKKNAVSIHFAPPDCASIASVCFHPSNDLIGYRSLQKRPYYNYVCESICLYDVRNTLAHCHSELGQYYSDFPRGRMLAMKEDVHVAYDYELIKEINFSPDGRLIAAPSSNTVKLLAAANLDHFFNPNQKTSNDLYDMHSILHQNPVICCAFAPRDVLLATGCTDGEVYIHQPVL